MRTPGIGRIGRAGFPRVTAGRLVLLMLAPIFFAGDLIAETATIHLETTVNAPVSEVWRAWTTEEGLISFLAPAVKVRMEVGGPFEIYFNPSLPEGTRGSEGSVILAFEEESMLSFTWNAPPGMPAIRMQRTHVTVRLRAVDANATLVTLDHDGWGRSEEWLRARAYFERAWGEVVLPNLRKRFG